MTVPNKPYPVVEYWTGRFCDWVKSTRRLSELRRLNTGDFGRIAGELRVSSTEIKALVRRGSHAADELPKLLNALGINEKALARTEPQSLRDMERVCALCTQKRRCNRDLAAGTSAEHYEEYCLNTSTIDGLGRGAS
jgi:hypothetical protein